MEAQLPKRVKKGKKKARVERISEPGPPEESELSDLQKDVQPNVLEGAEFSISSDAGKVAETEISDPIAGSSTRQPLGRSDSELSSIVVVSGESSKPVKHDDFQSLEGITSARTEAAITEPDSEAQNISPELGLKIIEGTTADESVVDIVAENPDIIEDESIQSKDSIEEISELPLDEETPRRNLVPEGLSDSLENDNLQFEPPVSTEEPNDVELDDGESHFFSTGVEEVDENAEVPWQIYKDLKRKEMSNDDLNDADTNGENVGNGPPKSDDVPDMDQFMGSLENNDSGLGSWNAPPTLYENPSQKEMHKYVEELQQNMADEEISAYLDEFERKVEEEIIHIGDISLEDVQEEERRLREEHIAYQQREARQQRDRQKELMLAMEKAKKHVMTMFRRKCKLILMRQEHLMQRDRLLQDRIHRSFRRSENKLLKALTKRQGEVKTMYGDLVFADGQYDGSKCRRWKVDWIRTPQPIQVKLKCLRGVKNKLPASRYVLMASLYSRLGGHVMKWANLKGQKWGGATLPINHDGEFFNIEVTIDQSVFAVCPSCPDMKAGMILMFELMILRGAVTPIDKVVGWGCFPISDGNFNVIEGKHKTPLLRGNMDPAMDKFGTIEKLISSDIDHWLCNLYFEVIKLPKYLAGQREYEVELQFTSQTAKLLSKEIELTEKPLYQPTVEKVPPPSILASDVSLQSSRPPPYTESKDADLDAEPGPSHFNPANLTIDVPAVPERMGSERSASPTPSSVKLRKMSQISSAMTPRKLSNAPIAPEKTPNKTASRPFTVYGSRKVVEEKGVKLSDEDSSSDSEYSDDDVYVVGKADGLKAIEGQPGMYYKVRQTHQGDHESNKFYTLLPKTPLLTQQQKRRKLTHLEELDQHTFAVSTKPSVTENVLRKKLTKYQYVRRMMLLELDLWQWRSKEFWSMMLMLVLMWWVRMYLHYVGEYILLVGLLIPINSIEYLPYTVNIKYENTILRTKEEIALVVVGPFTNIIILSVLILFTLLFQILYDRFPNLFARVIMAFGIQTALDPVWILIVDTAKGRYKNLGADNPIGDAYRLFYHFSRYYSSGTVTLFISISIIVFLYVVTIFCTGTILYMYFLRLHNNGRMMDTYWRLHGKEGDFFLPYDLELSNDELGYICRKAEQWRGQEGEQRKVNVYHYSWEEEEVIEEEWEMTKKSKMKRKSRPESIAHISIHTIHLDGLRELYRHFLRLHNGAIVEVFGEVNLPGSSNRANFRKDSFLSRSPKLGIRNRSYSASSTGSSVAKFDNRRASSQFLVLPSAAPN